MVFSKENFDAIIIGSGIGGLVTASQLAAKGARVLVLELNQMKQALVGIYSFSD